MENEQKLWYDLLNSKTFPTNLKVARIKFNTEIKEYKPGVRVNQDKYLHYDERNVAVNEIIFDLDFKSYKKNYKIAKKIIKVLDERKYQYIICSTGGKGLHIHLWFNPLNLSKENKEKFTIALEKGLTYKAIRLWLVNVILDDAGIDKGLIGKGKKIDTAPLIFNYLNGTTHLIRGIGGRKVIVEPETLEETTYYKTYIPITEFNDKQVKVTNRESVKYPQIVPVIDIDENELIELINEYADKEEKTFEQFDYKGKYLEIDGVKQVMAGLETGQRSAGAQILAIACKLDKLKDEEVNKLFKDYVKHCSSKDNSFTLNEALSWWTWIKHQPVTFWNCQLLKDLDLHVQHDCEFCKSKNKKSIELLENPKLLDYVKDILDFKVVGEDYNKILIFLLMLSKDFPSESGSPGWKLPCDMMSQNVILASDSSSGKSWLAKAVIELFGEEGEDYFILSRITDSALNYYTEHNMDGKIIFLEEMQGIDNATKQLRVWMSEGRLTLNSVEKRKDTEGNETNCMVLKNVIGQPSFVTCQAEGIVGDQLLNRSWIISSDVSNNQTKSILKHQFACQIDSSAKNNKDIQVLKNALKQLKNYHIIVPYLNPEKLNLNFDDIRLRRDYNKLVTLIHCSAHLHQKQRCIVEDEQGNKHIVANNQDYEIVRKYANNVLGATFCGLTENQIHFLKELNKFAFKDEFMISDLKRALGKSQQYWFSQLEHLENLGFIDIEKSIGKSNIYSISKNKQFEDLFLLPKFEEIYSKNYDILELKKSSPTTQFPQKWVKNQQKTGKPYSIIYFADYKKSYKIHSNSEFLVVGEGCFKHDSPTTESLRIAPENFLEGENLKKNKKFGVENFESDVVGDKKSNIYNRTDILEYIKKSKNHLIFYGDLIKKFTKEDDLIKILNLLKKEGTIMEGKPNYYMLL